MDISNVARRLWVGGRPPFERDLPEFDMLALCAREIQPERLAFHGQVVRCPIPDSVLSDREIGMVLQASSVVSTAMVTGKRVLVTCAQGINRSALVAGLALARVKRIQADDLINLMRLRRHPQALGNRYFQGLLAQFARHHGR
jgi:protein-tyrosine phosphatase